MFGRNRAHIPTYLSTYLNLDRFFVSRGLCRQQGRRSIGDRVARALRVCCTFSKVRTRAAPRSLSDRTNNFSPPSTARAHTHSDTQRFYIPPVKLLFLKGRDHDRVSNYVLGPEVSRARINGVNSDSRRKTQEIKFNV